MSPDDQRYDRLYRQLWRPARAMVRRAFGSAFSEEEIEDAYGNAWLGTLRALSSRNDDLSDDELRKYLLTAVANQASKELRRRGRRPVAPLDDARRIPDTSALPDERVTQREESRIARDILATLPSRRRAVLLFRYGWGLEPDQVCGLIDGLSHRAYRKEITRGVDELTAKLRLVDEGRWCGDREPVLKAYAAGIADDEQRRQAEQHLAHCRHCADYVGKLSGHLHELGASIAWTGAADAIDGRGSLADRVGAIGDRAREAVSGLSHRGGEAAEPAGSQLAVAGGPRGAGAGAAGVVAKIASLGAAGKITAACVGTGVAATACVAAGVAPGVGFDPKRDDRPATERRADGSRFVGVGVSAANGVASAVASRPYSTSLAEDGSSGAPAADTGRELPPEPVSPVAPSTPPVQQEFGVESAAPSGGSSGGSGGGGAASKEFGP